MVQYYFKVSDGPDLGPMGADEFQQRHQAGEINDETMVWRSGMVDWKTYGALRAAEERAAQPQAAKPPPLPREKPLRAGSPPRAGFLACGLCTQEWPETLLSL